MAAGDIITAIVDVATATDVDFQPGAGVEIIITFIGSNAQSSTDTAKITDGTNQVTIFAGTISTMVGGPINQHVKLGITNTTYLRQQHEAGSNRYLGYSGVQTK